VLCVLGWWSIAAGCRRRTRLAGEPTALAADLAAAAGKPLVD